ncbi:MAG: hypothetical protein ACP5RM_00580 [Candidatus Micrarchaeia archaeon]
MPIDPNSLLIFEMREEEKAKGSAKGKGAPKQQFVPVQQNPQQKVEQQVSKNIGNASRQSQQVQPQKEYNQPQSSVQQRQSRPVPQPPERSVGNQQYETGNGLGYVINPPSEDEVEEALGVSVDRAATTAMVSSKKKYKNTRSEQESREAAMGLYCTWHPWRPAYAVCAYCHRPFCFEDLTEANGNYYCLEDIDKVVAKGDSTVYVKYNNLGIVSASLLLASFVVFIYFAEPQILYMIKYSNSVGILEFLSKFGGNFGYVFLGVLLSILMVVAGVLIFVQSRRSFIVGLFVSFGSVALFSYQYLSTGTMYAAIVSVTSFAGLVSLLYSRTAYEGSEIEDFAEEAESPGEVYPTEVPNIGRF